MGITLNILEYELQRLGTVVRRCEENPSFDNARMYLGKESLQDANTVYVCDDIRSLKTIVRAGFFPLYVNFEKSESLESEDIQSYLCVIGCESKLLILNELLDIFANTQNGRTS